MTKPTNHIEILNQVPQVPQAPKYSEAAAEHLAQRLAQLLSVHGQQARELTLLLCDDDAIQKRNREHRGVDAVTDVLSYPLNEPEDIAAGFPEVPHLGDIVISLDTALRQAEQQQHSLELEVALLAAHGLMHLLGYDHPTEEAWHVFRESEKQMRQLY